MDVILECNQNTADHVYQNGNFVSSFPTGIPVYTGDTVSARLCSIDSQKSDTNTIVVDQEVFGSITFSYYDNDYDDLAQKQTHSGGSWPYTTAQYYAGYADTQIMQLLTAWVDIPWQSMQGVFRVKLWMSWIKEDGSVESPSEATCTGFAHYEPPLFNDDHIVALPRLISIPVYREGSLQLTKFELDMPDGSVIHDGKWYDPSKNTNQNIGAPIVSLSLQKVNFTIPAGRYDPSEISQLITQQISSPNGVKPVYVGGNQLYVPNNNCLVNSQDPLASNFTWAPITNAPVVIDDTCYKYIANLYRFFGADLVALQYGINGPIFQFSYMHTPIYNSASPNKKNAAVIIVGTRAAGSLTYNLVTAATGLTIHSIDPPDFWTSLGLIDPNQPIGNQPVTTQLFVNPTNGLQYYTYNGWNATAEGDSLNFSTPGYNRQPDPPSDTVITYYETDAIQPFALLGSELNSNPDGGYLLVRGAMNVGTTKYFDNKNIYDSIAAIVSTQYNTANSITGFGDAAIPFVNKGAPFVLSSITIDVLDAKTKQTAPQLGSNNTVIFQVTRAQRLVEVIDQSGNPVDVPVLFD